MENNKTKTPVISKSKYLSGLQCQKLLWYHYNRSDEIPAPDAATQAIFAVGHEVGELAQNLFPGGEVIKWDRDTEKMTEPTKKLLAERKPIFEAAVKYGNAYSIADILAPVDDNRWDLIEVKSSTAVKDINLPDVAIQSYVCQNSGIKLNKIFLMHINNQYVRQGDIEPEKLFAKEDITEQAQELLLQVEPNLEKMVRIIQGAECPDIKIGPHCNNPYECPLKEICWAFLPQDNVFSLYRGKTLGFELLQQKVQKLADIPPGTILSSSQSIQVKCAKTNKPHIDKKGIANFLSTLQYPLYFLDFETVAPAIPIYDGTRPYQNIPFQFSLHIVGKEGGKPEHHSFLAEGKGDPRPEILKELKSLLGNSGSIIAYNAGFETGCLEGCAESYPQYSEWVAQIKRRIIDLLGPFKSFCYYHPEQNGSASLKSVLPALTGKGYEGMEIADGGTASREYARVTFGDAGEEERLKVRKHLVEYCGQDTEGMIWIVKELTRIIS
jgi:hypothetical protein